MIEKAAADEGKETAAIEFWREQGIRHGRTEEYFI